MRDEGVEDGHASVEEKLLVFLYICGNGLSWGNAKYQCGRSLDTVSYHFHQILDSLCRLYPTVVCAPSGEISDAVRLNPKRWPYFSKCVGALDGTHLSVHQPANEQ
ncbi:hypothetical protein EJ02DRAFT_350053, partial [Clathrospora elynae]